MTAKHHGRSGMTEQRSFLKKNLKTIIGVFISLIALYLFIDAVKFDGLVNEIKKFEILYIFYGLISLSLGYFLRIYRWSFILSKTDQSVSFRKCVAPFMGSIALNNTLPLRAGDILRVLVFPQAINISKTQSLGSILIERLFDISILLLFIVLFVPFAYSDLIILFNLNFPYTSSAWFIALFISAILIISLSFKTKIVFFLKNYLYKFLEQNLYMFTLHKISIVTFSTVLIWIAEAGLFYFILKGLSVDLSFIFSLYIMAIITMGTLIPSSPGYIGTFHFIAYTGLFFTVKDSSIAGSFAIISHTTLWLSTTMVGLILICFNLKLFEGFKSSRAENNG